MTNATPTYTRAELEAALRLGEGTALGIHITILSAKNKYMRIDERAARILADHIRRVEQKCKNPVVDVVPLLRGEDLP